MTHPAKRRHGDVVTTSLCTSQRCRRYVSNETPNDISVERRQDVSVVRLHGVLLVYRDHVSRGRNDDVSSVRLHDVSNETPNDVSVVRHQNVSGTYPRRPIRTSLRRLLKLPNETPNNVAVVRLNHVSELRCRDALSVLRSLLCFQITLSWPPAGRFSRLI